MELFDRAKSILLNPKEEWEVIEAENTPHAKVLTGYLLPVALIPAVAILINYYRAFRSSYNDIIAAKDWNPESINCFKEYFAFGSWVKWGIIDGITTSLIIVGSVYAAAWIINALAEKFGSKKNFDRAFSLVAYSFTPLCIAGILYIFGSLAWLVPYAGIYGLYLLYIGVKPRMKPLEDKLATYCIIALVAACGSWYILNNQIVPEIRENVITSAIEQKSNEKNNEYDNDNPCKSIRKSIEEANLGYSYMQNGRHSNSLNYDAIRNVMKRN